MCIIVKILVTSNVEKGSNNTPLYTTILFQVTSENEENCDYLLEYNNGQFLDVIHTLYKFLDEEVPLNSSS